MCRHSPEQELLCEWGKEYMKHGGIPVGDVQAYYDLCVEYGYYCSIDEGHFGTQWDVIHMHFGENRKHLAIIY